MSAKLKELQAQLEREQAAMEQELSSSTGDGGNGNRSADTAIEVKLPSGRTGYAEDAEGEEEAERKSLLRRKQQQQHEADTTRLSPGKIAAIVAVGVVVALLLLLLLFSGDDASIAESSQPLTLTQLKAERPHNPCPDPWWIPEECQGEERIKSRSVWDNCQEFFDKYEYTVTYLKKTCHIPVKEGKLPKKG